MRFLPRHNGEAAPEDSTGPSNGTDRSLVREVKHRSQAPFSPTFLGISIGLHGLVALLIWLAWPTSERSLERPPTQSRVAPRVVEEIRREVERRQLAELEMKLSELSYLQSEISRIRERREAQWAVRSEALAQIAPEVAAIVAETAAVALTSVTELAATEAANWDRYSTVADAIWAHPRGATDGLPVSAVRSHYEALRIGLAALREQQRILREKLSLDPELADSLVTHQSKLEGQVAELIAHLDTIQAAREGFENRAGHRRGLLERVQSFSGQVNSRESRISQLQAEVSHLTGERDQRLAGYHRAQEALQAIDPSDARGRANAERNLARAENEWQRREKAVTDRQNELARNRRQRDALQATLDTDRAALPERESQMRTFFETLKEARSALASELAMLIEEQNRVILAVKGEQ